jgi:hypothetical protein
MAGDAASGWPAFERMMMLRFVAVASIFAERIFQIGIADNFLFLTA